MKIILCIILITLATGCVSPWRHIPDADALSTSPAEIVKKDIKEPVYLAVNRLVSANRTIQEHELAKRFSDRLSRALIDDSSFRIVSRTEMDRILEEQELGMSGLVNSKMAASMGRLAGAKAIIIGKLSLARHREEGFPLKYVKVNVELQLIDTETAELIASIDSTGFEEYDYSIKESDMRSAVDRAVKAVYIDVHNYMTRRFN